MECIPVVHHSEAVKHIMTIQNISGLRALGKLASHGKWPYVLIEIYPDGVVLYVATDGIKLIAYSYDQLVTNLKNSTSLLLPAQATKMVKYKTCERIVRNERDVYFIRSDSDTEDIELIKYDAKKFPCWREVIQEPVTMNIPCIHSIDEMYDFISYIRQIFPEKGKQLTWWSCGNNNATVVTLADDDNFIGMLAPAVNMNVPKEIADQEETWRGVLHTLFENLGITHARTAQGNL